MHFGNIFAMVMFCVFVKNQKTFSKLLWIIIKWCKILKTFDLRFDVSFWLYIYMCVCVCACVCVCCFYYETMTWRNKGLKEFLCSFCFFVFSLCHFYYEIIMWTNKDLSYGRVLKFFGDNFYFLSPLTNCYLFI